MQRRGLEEQGQEKIGSQISIALHYSLRVLLARMKWDPDLNQLFWLLQQ